jgi:hypothetical protein
VVSRDEDDIDDAASWDTVQEDDEDDGASWETVDYDLVKLIPSNMDIEQTKEEDISHSFYSSSCHNSGHFTHFGSVKDPVDHSYQNKIGKVYL